MENKSNQVVDFYFTWYFSPLIVDILWASPGARLRGHSPLVHHRAELSVAQLVILDRWEGHIKVWGDLAHFVSVVFLEGGLNLSFAHSPPGPDGGGDHFIFTDEAVRVDIQCLFKETQMGWCDWERNVLFLFWFSPRTQFLFWFFYRKILRSWFFHLCLYPESKDK